MRLQRSQSIFAVVCFLSLGIASLVWAVIVEVEIVPRGATWKYLDDGSDQGVAWVAPAFDDTAWAEGPAELGYGEDIPSELRPEATVVSFGGNPNDKYITTYFRHEFDVVDAERITALSLELLRDDGAAVYLNGTEVARDNLGFGAAFDDFATATVGATREDETTYFPFPGIDPSLLIDGTNILAVEIHQVNRVSSDISFDLSLTATVVPIPEPTTLTLTAIDPTTADDVLDVGSGTRFAIVILPDPGTIGILNHPGEPDGNLVMWFVLTGLSELLTEGELDDLAIGVRGLEGILDARRIEPVDSPDFIPIDANLMVTFDGGASPGQSTTIQYDFGPDVRMIAFAVPEPSTLTLAALGLLGLAGWRPRVSARSAI